MDYIARCECGAGMQRAFLKAYQRPRDGDAVEWIEHHEKAAGHKIVEKWG